MCIVLTDQFHAHQFRKLVHVLAVVVKFTSMQTQEIENKLKSKDVKPTAMRILVLQYFQGRTSATTLRQLEDHFDGSEMTTLYRTLKTLLNKIKKCLKIS